MRLAGLIEALAALPPDLPVYVGDEPAGPLGSYRGYYNQLTIYRAGGRGHGGNATPVTVAELLADARDADGKIFTGYKGGDYTMDLDTTVWADDYSMAYGTAIAELVQDADRVTIVTFNASNYQGF
jgi:hypothetical protein